MIIFIFPQRFQDSFHLGILILHYLGRHDPTKFIHMLKGVKCFVKTKGTFTYLGSVIKKKKKWLLSQMHVCFIVSFSWASLSPHLSPSPDFQVQDGKELWISQVRLDQGLEHLPTFDLWWEPWVCEPPLKGLHWMSTERRQAD